MKTNLKPVSVVAKTPGGHVVITAKGGGEGPGVAADKDEFWPHVGFVQRPPDVGTLKAGESMSVARFPLEPLMAMQPEAVHAASRPQTYALRGWDDEEPFDRQGPLAIITISGPLMQRGGFFWDGFEAIRSRLGAALSDPGVGAVALLLNSPGGVAAGCFEAAAAMRKMKAAAGKPVYAFADEMAYSAGYAMACVADEIYLPEPGGVGSVGVIGVLFDAVKFNEDIGFNVVVIASGAQKADGHPDAPLTEEAIARYRDRTNQLAGLFGELVAESRGKTKAEVLSLEAGCFYGRGAVSAGLANGVKTRDQFLAYAMREAKKSLPKTVATSSARRVMATKDNAAAGGEQNGGELLAVGIASSFSAVALALGINHAADEGSIIARCTALRDFEREAFKVAGKENANDVLGALQAGKIAIGQVETLRTENASLKGEQSKRDVDGLIDTGKREGKITSPAFEAEMRTLGAENPARLRSVLAALPVIVTEASRQPTKEPVVQVTLTTEEIQVAKQMGITTEQLMQQKAAAQAAKGAQ